AVPELLLHGPLHPFHFAVQVGCTGLYVSMSDAQALEEESELAAELRTVVGLDAAKREGEGRQQAGQGPADGGSRTGAQHRGSQITAAVIDQRKLEAAFGQVFEVHLRALAGQSPGVADPVRLWLSRPHHQRPAAAE